MAEAGRTIMATRQRGSITCPVMTLALLERRRRLRAATVGACAAGQARQGHLSDVLYPSVQPQFERGVAMLHSYWFIQARKTFEAVLQQDPSCAMAYWGIAVDLLGNTLAATPTPQNLQMAWEALEKARAIGAKTPRERDWIEALSAYYRDHETGAGRGPTPRLYQGDGAGHAALS